ncbi:hypothetical protein KIW84_050254 [Lathyrus oleraceus]|uniref:Uncharacterized protein n=1 Tax=Pisum sativum TaxID=3888 RepID=A0A9D4WKR0_PEA|nr:hypothetical protein KIW84_050254 [Pisum sativum]
MGMREAYKTCYETNVSPINGMDMWPNVDVEDMLPPQYKKGPEAFDKVVEKKKKVTKAIEKKTQVFNASEKKKQVSKATEKNKKVSKEVVKKKQVAKAVEKKKKSRCEEYTDT